MTQAERSRRQLMKCGMRMTGPAGLKWVPWLGDVGSLPPSASLLILPGRVCDGVSPLSLSPCVNDGEELTPRSPKPGASPPSLFHPRRQNPSPEPPAGGA